MYSEDCMKDMIRDIGKESFHQANVYDSLKDNSRTELYPGCSSFSRLSAVLRLFNMKARNGWIDRSFTNCLNFCMKYFLKVIHCRPVTMRPRRYCVQWVWTTKKYMLVQMIVYMLVQGGWECRYYIMHWMRTITRVSITYSWEEVHVLSLFLCQLISKSNSSFYIYLRFFKIKSH